MRPVEDIPGEDDLPKGWTRWHGETTECPCPGLPADVMFADGHVQRACVQLPKADDWYWKHGRSLSSNIIAYRVVEKTW